MISTALEKRKSSCRFHRNVCEDSTEPDPTTVANPELLLPDTVRSLN